jgi:predicted transcriptional regulator
MLFLADLTYQESFTPFRRLHPINTASKDHFPCRNGAIQKKAGGLQYRLPMNIYMEFASRPLATGGYMKKFIQVVGLTGTIEILKYLKEHEIVTYTELIQFASVSTLNKRLNQLVNFRLIEHHFEKKNRKEWYTITEKGIEALNLIEKLILLTT